MTAEELKRFEKIIWYDENGNKHKGIPPSEYGNLLRFMEQYHEAKTKLEKPFHTGEILKKNYHNTTDRKLYAIAYKVYNPDQEYYGGPEFWVKTLNPTYPTRDEAESALELLKAKCNNDSYYFIKEVGSMKVLVACKCRNNREG